MTERKVAEIFSPGEFIREELEARSWTQEDLAEILGRPLRLVNEIIGGKRGITPETAKGLAGAFGTSSQLWMNLESSYRLSLNNSEQSLVERKAALYDKAPVRLMVKRSWIEDSSSIDVLEQRLRIFFGVDDLKKIPKLNCMTRKSTNEITPEQNAWLFRVKNLSQALSVEQYSRKKLDVALEQLKALLNDESNIRLIPKILAKCGIKFIIVEPLPSSKIDGVSFWINGIPIIAMSLRYDRVDSFWHTLMHEIGHIKNEDSLKNNCVIIDTDLFELPEDSKPYEKAADDFAVKFLVPQDELDNFIDHVQPIYSKSKIILFAKRIGVHPGIVVGQLHYRGREQGGLDYSFSRNLLTKIRQIIVNSALTDGYGQVLPSNLN